MMGVAPHPRDPAQVYAVSKSGQVFGTRDGGESWTRDAVAAGRRRLLRDRLRLTVVSA